MHENWTKLVTDCRNYLETAPDFSREKEAEELNQCGCDYYERGDARTAITYHEKALNILWASPEFHFNLGVDCQTFGNEARAAYEFRRAISLGLPEDILFRAYYFLGVCYRNMGRLHHGIYFLRKLRALAPNYEVAQVEEDLDEMQDLVGKPVNLDSFFEELDRNNLWATGMLDMVVTFILKARKNGIRYRIEGKGYYPDGREALRMEIFEQDYQGSGQNRTLKMDIDAASVSQEPDVAKHIQHVVCDYWAFLEAIRLAEASGYDHAQIHFYFADFNRKIGRFRQADEEIRKALTLKRV
ncbi:MAG: hypothetical protein GX130_01345 [Candidatus Hydrogenedens sp.]|jgi:tetratricopeptide (TPR) repeat protein|nr:hypothetical protein [Candidatus Hydrogenedens sp.]